MRAYPEVAFTLDSRRRKLPATAAAVLARPAPVDGGVPRVARLMGIAIRLNGLVRAGAIRDYAEAARLGGVTRARLTQIMKLLDLAPDIQEQILFLPSNSDLNERRLRPVTAFTDWGNQRRIFQEITAPIDHLH